MIRHLNYFIRQESAGGIVLIIATICALIATNSPLVSLYSAFLQTPIHVSIGDLIIDKPALLWINDGLMALFFLLAGMEIKREMQDGSLANLRAASLPLFAALGGMLVPALLYLAVAGARSSVAHGWAIPVATDIAFAVGILALLGKRVPGSLKVFLLALAIIDDLGAILVIALFYTDTLHLVALAWAAFFTLVLFGMNRLRILSLPLYALVGVCLWVAVLKSGIHATIAGVILGFAIPHMKGEQKTPLKYLEHHLHPWTAFIILPLFAFANAGLPFVELAGASLINDLSLAVLCGLFIGKPIGVLLFSILAVRFNIASLPARVCWKQLFGVALLCGIGFTMSIFIMNLAFGPHSEYAESARFGILIASLFSAVAGYLYLFCTQGTLKSQVRESHVSSEL
jgi:NhaA family Na+:H+ antiporter